MLRLCSYRYMFRAVLLLLCCLCAPAQVRTVTLREAVDLALRQNPDVVLARLEERRVDAAVRIAKSPFIPRVAVGSGLAYTSGMPLGIGQNAPSLFLAEAVSTIFDRTQSYRIAAARENRRTAAFETAVRQEEVAYRAATAYLDAEAAARALDVARGESRALENVLETVRARVAEGRELPIAAKRAELALARASYRIQTLETALAQAESTLALITGLDAVRVVPVERPAPVLPASAQAAVASALENNREIRALESRVLAKGFDVRAARAAWLPRADFVAQYALVSKINNYEEFYKKYVPNNAQVGVAFMFPFWPGPAAGAEAEQAEAEAAQYRVQLRNARRRVEENVRQSYAALEQAEAAQRLARLDLDVAREQVSVVLAQTEEGRASLRDLEEARVAETDKWIAFLDANAALEKARFAVLRSAGTLISALRD